MEIWKKIAGYLTFKKINPEDPSNFNLKAMHVINKISIFMFLIGVILMIIKLTN